MVFYPFQKAMGTGRVVFTASGVTRRGTVGVALLWMWDGRCDRPAHPQILHIIWLQCTRGRRLGGGAHAPLQRACRRWHKVASFQREAGPQSCLREASPRPRPAVCRRHLVRCVWNCGLRLGMCVCVFAGRGAARTVNAVRCVGARKAWVLHAASRSSKSAWDLKTMQGGRRRRVYRIVVYLFNACGS